MFQVDYFLTRNATCYPDRLAVATGKGALTWKELDGRATWLAQALATKGVRKGMRVAVLWHNSIEWALIWYACQRLGAVPMPLNTRLLPEEIVRHVELAMCEVMFCAARFTAAAQSVAATSELELLIVETSPATDSLEAVS
ncbi:AMP-binding protein [Eggerthella guodeyinii]|uniref:AMP-binding protein n=2 Tax=Eggerthella TaxID=84111 RepID=A0A6L7INL5_9ACTN|nr:AMP-binding protein [Eggerthella guodeyinii]